MTDKPTSAPKDAPGDVAGLVHELRASPLGKEVFSSSDGLRRYFSITEDLRDRILAALSAPQHPAEQSIERSLAAIIDVRARNAGDFTREGASWEAYDRGVLDCHAAVEALTFTPTAPLPETTPQPAGDAGELAGMRHQICLLLSDHALPVDEHTGIPLGHAVEALADKILAALTPSDPEPSPINSEER